MSRFSNVNCYEDDTEANESRDEQTILEFAFSFLVFFSPECFKTADEIEIWLSDTALSH